MKRNIFIANRVREVFLNGTWIANTNFKDQLAKVTWQQAVQKVGSLNTIAALTFHINYYIAGLLSAFQNGKLEIRDKYSFDMLPVNSEQDWNTLVKTLLENSEAFAAYVEQMPDEKFEEPFIDPKYSNYLRNIEGMIEHGYYHLGQIPLIRKLISEA